MKYCAGLLALLLPVTAAAQLPAGGVIGLYPDATIYCMIIDRPGPRTVYVIQRFSQGSMSSRFRIEPSPGFTGTIVSVSAPDGGSSNGDPLTGITVDYTGECRYGSFVVLEVSLMLYGTSSECSWIRTAPHPLSADGMLDSYDCAGIRRSASWNGTHVQHEPWLYCPDLSGPPGHTGPGCRPVEEPLPVRSATWGSVKALYR